ncbi:DNA-binding response regulator [Paraliomyxa miuraensis]|uniref:DNA-binding response regulator n=1 Tax=Paraliomyxa miuraensis TaxID=376150 RepID=UPI0022570BD3|nr:response regulator [Paraliomyxa miuraensis]MCX4240069.1 response regulator [Paraliomyxa miuraensis]
MNELVASILLAEDDPVIARLLGQLLIDAGHHVVGTVGRSTDLIAALERDRPDVLLLDIGMETDTAGLDLAESDVIPEQTSIVFVSGRSDEATMQRVQRIAPAGFVVKPFTAQQVLAAVRVALGQARQPTPVTEDAARQLTLARDVLSKIAQELERVASLLSVGVQEERRLRELVELSTLSPREREVLRGLVNHKRPMSIAKDLYISHHTVRNHLKSIFTKLGVHSQAELLEKVLEPPS